MKQPIGDVFLDHHLLTFFSSVHGEIGEGDGAESEHVLIGRLAVPQDGVQATFFQYGLASVFAVFEELTQNAGADARDFNVGARAGDSGNTGSK